MSFFDKLFFRKPSKDKFAKDLLRGIQAAGEQREVAYDKSQYAIRTPEKDGGLLNLVNGPDGTGDGL